MTESLFGVREEQSPPPEDEERRRIFFSHALAQRTTQWERGDEPMTQFGFTGDYDAYGQPQSQTSTAVPRGRDYRVETSESEPYLATHSVTRYAQRDDSQTYIVDRGAKDSTYEILNDGTLTVFQLLETIRDGTASTKVIGHTLNFYDGPAFEGLPLYQIGDYGAPVRTETLVLTEDILHEAYKSGDAIADPPEVPPYLIPGITPPWTPEYPQEFRDSLPPLAGYLYQPGGGDSEYSPGYYVETHRQKYDFHEGPGRGSLRVNRDPLGRDTTIDYDGYDFLPTQVTDLANLTTHALHDYRVLQPSEITVPNGNRTRFAFTPQGILERTAVMGKLDEDVGDTLDTPGTKLEYDFFAFMEHGQPVSVRTIGRVHHVHDSDVPLPERDETIETVEYSDGFGRLLQTRTHAEDLTFVDPVFGDAGLPADQSLPVPDAVGTQREDGDPPNVLVSGWQIYNNKGWVVEKYEPFFRTDWEHATPTDEQRGQKVALFYDPRGQVIRTVNPDGSEQRIIYGTPDDLADPELFTPTPWEAYTYDSNDNAGRTHPTESLGYEKHWNTPSSAVVDALGRMFETIARNGPDSATDWNQTKSTYDIRGNLLKVEDALGRDALRTIYDLANNPLRTESIDAGIRRMLLDAVGNPVEQRDSKGALILHSYDLLSRPVRLWARDGDGESITLRERLIYGDSAGAGSTAAQTVAKNLLGKPYQHYDEAGRVIIEGYDFKGNILEQVRQVISDNTILKVFDPPPPDWQVPAFRVNWQPTGGMSLESHAAGLLDLAEYRTTLAYDALNRVKWMLYPEDVEGQRKELRPHYNRAGALENVALDGETFVEHIAHNAKGQRTLVAYGNGVMTRHAYDPQTFRLKRLRSTPYTRPDEFTYHPTGQPPQDFAYAYDLVGNITKINDRTPGSGIPSAPDKLDRTFIYDPIYRLLSATGRECDTPPDEPLWKDQLKCHDATLTRAYKRTYKYDPVGNMGELGHQAGVVSFTSKFDLVANTNRLKTVTIGPNVFDYTYDVNGNLVREITSRHFEWDHADQMRVYRTQAGNAEPSVHAHYLYDAAGQRVKKLVRKQGGEYEVTVYVGGVFEYHRLVKASSTNENNTLHVMDDQSRIATVRVGIPFPDDSTPAVKYHLGDHLTSSNVVIDESGSWINREEYLPYGETSFGSFARKRYRYTGKERDEESGLHHHGARYYAPWLGRWISTDPAGMVDGVNVYHYCRNNPMRLTDRAGTQAKAQEGLTKPVTDMSLGYKRVQEPTIEEAKKTGTSLEQTNLSLSNPKSTLTKSDAERRKWYVENLGGYEKQLLESAKKHGIPAQLLAAVILNELADIGPHDIVQASVYTGQGSFGIAQIQIDTVIKDDLMPGMSGHEWHEGMPDLYVTLRHLTLMSLQDELRVSILSFAKTRPFSKLLNSRQDDGTVTSYAERAFAGISVHSLGSRWPQTSRSGEPRVASSNRRTETRRAAAQTVRSGSTLLGGVGSDVEGLEDGSRDRAARDRDRLAAATLQTILVEVVSEERAGPAASDGRSPSTDSANGRSQTALGCAENPWGVTKIGLGCFGAGRLSLDAETAQESVTDVEDVSA